MNSVEKNKFTNYIKEQYKCLYNIQMQIESELYEEEDTHILERKIQKLKEIKKLMINIYSIIVSEF